jgi:hypothetical protein
MLRKLWMVLFAFLITCAGAFANSVTYTVNSATLNIFPNDGSGDNVGFLLSGPGMTLSAGGGTNSFFIFQGSAPGSIGSAMLYLFPDYVASGNIGSYGPGEIELNCCSGAALFSGTFTFPSNGQSFFSVTLPAYLTGISGTIVSGSGSTFFEQPFTLSGVSGHETLSFYYSSYWNLYYPAYGSFSTIPEPNTWVLLATGLCAALGSLPRRNKS